MRIPYKPDHYQCINSPLFLIGKIQVYVSISIKTLTYSIMEYEHQDSEVTLHSGQCNSIRMCKVNAKAKLKELGVVFNTEARRSND